VIVCFVVVKERNHLEVDYYEIDIGFGESCIVSNTGSQQNCACIEVPIVTTIFPIIIDDTP
jgi:hypothetical protein